MNTISEEKVLEEKVIEKVLEEKVIEKVIEEKIECEKDKKDLNKILFFDGKPKPPPVVEGVETLTQKIKKLNILERFFKK